MMRAIDGSAMIGRSAELAEWRRLLNGLPAGGSVFAIVGEAGIGKSRLAAEFGRLAADAGARVLRGHAREGNMGTAYAPLVEALMPLTRAGKSVAADLADSYRSALGLIVPDWRRPDAETAAGDGLVVAEGVVRLLASVAGEAGTVLIIEDTQWADPDTRAVLEHLARAAESVPVSLVTTTRTGQVTGADPAVAAAAMVAPVRLGRLDDGEQHAMITATVGAVPDDVSSRICERAEGLPLAIEEILADLVRIGGGPESDGGWTSRPELVAAATAPSIDAMVAARLEGLPREALAAATAAALLDDVVSWREVATVAALEPDIATEALAGLVTAQILVAAGRDRYRYHHGLVRDAVEAYVPPSLVRQSAERAAKRIQNTGDPAECATAARLFERAELHQDAARLHAEASQRWLAIGALRSAETAARDALRLDVPGRAAEAADALAESLTRMGRYAEALEAMRAGFEAPATSRGPRAAVAHCRAARCALETGDRDAAGDHLDRADEIGGAAGEVAALRATLAFEEADLATAGEMADEAVRLAETAAAPELLCSALLVSARVARAGDPAGAFTVLDRLYDIAVAENLPDWRERAILELGLADRVTDGRPDRLRQAQREAAERGALHTLAIAELHLWVTLLEIGDIEEAQAVCDHVASITARYDLRPRELAVSMRSMLAAMRGRFDLSREIAEDIGDYLPGQVNHGVFFALCSGEPARALAIIDPVVGGLNASLDARPAPLRGMHALLRAGLHSDPGPAERLRADGIGAWTNRGLGLLAEAIVAGAAGRTGEADELARRAYADLGLSPVMAAIGAPIAIPHALADGWGAPRDWLHAAREQFVLLGNDLMRRHCETIMQDAGIPIPRRGRGDADVPPKLRAMGITSREMDVLLLITGDLTNAEIATRLSISRRTVDTHVSRLLAKTGRTRRNQLSDLLPNP